MAVSYQVGEDALAEKTCATDEKNSTGHLSTP